MKGTNHHKQQNVKSNFIKYLNPSILIQPKANRNKAEVSNIHCRSMEDLDLNGNLVSHSSISKDNLKKNMHYSSLHSDKQNVRVQQQPCKSRSLSKFLTFFQNSNLLNLNPAKKDTNEIKRKNYNGFSYDLKITANSTTNNNKKIIKKKDKQNVNYQTLNSQRQTNNFNQKKSPIKTINEKLNDTSDSGKKNQQMLLSKMKDVIQEQRKQEIRNSQNIKALQTKNQKLENELQKYKDQVEVLIKKLNQCEVKINELSAKNKQYQQKCKRLANKETKGSNKQSRQQDMVVKSLKKVINEQLNKIIELQRLKIQNQYLRQKLGDQNQSFVESSFTTNQDYSFDIETHQVNKKSSPTSTIKSDQSEGNQYINKMFKKSKIIEQKNQQKQKQHLKEKHFKSFFEIQESPRSADQNLMNLFRPSQTRGNQTKKEATKNTERQNNMIKIPEAQSSFTRQVIEEVNEDNCEFERQSSRNQYSSAQNQEDDSDLREEHDSILEEVDEYLTKWRNRQ